MNISKSRGFTLIELLVVIAIIGVLSTIVITSLSSSRTKAKDAAIKEEARQFAALFNLNYIDYGGYCELRAGWVNLQGACSAAFGGNYAADARNICAAMFNNAADISPPTGNYRLLITGAANCSNYSVMAALNNGKWYCLGSSGRKGEYTAYGGQPGCNDNP